ncbi:MAG: helix-turn-helix transcriptional regulator, partial [Oscillospiraceae bacterium]
MNIKENITHQLKSLRKENGLTQQQVADKINVSRSAYSQYEMGLKQPTIETLVEVSKLYRCSIDFIVGRYE